MAGRKENLKSLFANTRSRMIIVFTAVLLLLGVLIGYLKFANMSTGPDASSDLVSAPGGIQSIPGALNPTSQYAKLQEEQNVNQAKQAETSGGSAIPTIIRTQALGQGAGVIGSQEGESGVGFAALARQGEEGSPLQAWLQDLRLTNCSKVSLMKAVSQGAKIADLKSVCSCEQLKANGFSLAELNQACSCKELKALDYSASQLKSIGLSAGTLRECGFNACEERGAGFNAQAMKEGGFSDGELKGAGFSDDAIKKASGLPDGISAADVLRGGCSVDALTKLRQEGVSAAAIRRISGCSAAQLKAAGFDAKALKDAGFSAADLKKAGFTPAQLKDAGYKARDLLNAGFTPQDLASAGYTPSQIRDAESDLPPGISPMDVKNAGCDVDVLKQEREAGVSAATIHQLAGCSASDLKAAGFNNDDLANAGFTPEQIKSISPPSDAEIKAAGCDPVQLKKMLQAGVSAQQLKGNGCSAEALRNAGYNHQSLANAGFSPEQLQAAGFSPSQLAGTSPESLLAMGRKADCSVDYLRRARAAGMSAATIKQTLGCSALALKNAGYTPKELHDAGYTAGELKNAGFNARDLKDAGFSPKELNDAGFSAGDLKNAGFSAAEMKAAGLTAQDLKNAGFNDKELQAAGFIPEKSHMERLAPAPTTPAQPFSIGGIPSLQQQQQAQKTAADSNQELQAILNRQNQQMAEQKYQQKIQQKSSDMLSTANNLLSEWKAVSTQVYTAGEHDKSDTRSSANDVENEDGYARQAPNTMNQNLNQPAVIKTGDVLFAVMDTSVNSDEPGPILATIVTGKLKGTKLIGSFNMPSNGSRMVITFNTMSVPGAAKTTSISAYAIDSNTARTALSSRTNHHYLLRYGSLFASSFLEGFGNAFQSANTTVTIGGSGGGNDITINNGVGRSTLENAVIGLATVGKAWGQQAQQLFNKPTTVEVYSGTAVGVLFTQDVRTI